MSHVVTIRTQIKDAVAVQAACQRLGLPAPVQGTVKLFDGEATGLAVQLSGWMYPVVADLASGELRYDNFNGKWGTDSRLHEFLQTYAVCRATIEARRRGHSVTEQKLADGSIKLTIQVTGGAA
jgi:hypothetical protein